MRTRPPGQPGPTDATHAAPRGHLTTGGSSDRRPGLRSGSRSGLEDAALAGGVNGRGPVRDGELAVDRAEMVPDRTTAQVQPVRDLAVGQADRREAQHLTLASAERIPPTSAWGEAFDQSV